MSCDFGGYSVHLFLIHDNVLAAFVSVIKQSVEIMGLLFLLLFLKYSHIFDTLYYLAHHCQRCGPRVSLLKKLLTHVGLTLDLAKRSTRFESTFCHNSLYLFIFIY